MSFSVARCIINALRGSRSRTRINLTSSLTRASKIVTNILNKSAELPLAAIHGPPGTGKTTVYIHSISDHLKHGSVSLTELKENILYVTSLNRLVQDVFTRILQDLFSLGIIDIHDKNSLFNDLNSIRILGSQIIPFAGSNEINELSREFDGVLNVDDLEGILRSMTRREGKGKVRIVFTTEWQSATVGLERETFILVDEASKSPMFHAFTPVAREMLRGKTIDVHRLRLCGLTVIGDAQQAVSLEPEYRSSKGRELLLLPYIEDIVHNACKTGIMKDCEDYLLLLKETLRLPWPSETPISYGYYDGLLRAIYTLKDKINIGILSLINECLDEAYKTISPLKEYLGRVADVVTEYVERIKTIIDSYKSLSFEHKPPLIVINTGPYRYEPGREIEPHRVVIASVIALLLAQTLKCIYTRNGKLLTLAVITPYSELVNSIYQTFLHMESMLRSYDLEDYVQFSTVHAFLGGEADFVVAVLGREYYLSLYRLPIYFREPELLNVQLSRHKLMLTVIGSVEYFLNSAKQFNIDRKYKEPRLEITLQQLIDMSTRNGLEISYGVDRARYKRTRA
jgi:DNA polymerase III delta prime subunit